MRFLCKHLPCGIVNFLLQTSLRMKIQLPAKCGSWVAGDKLEMSQQHALAARQALGLHWRSSARRLREEISLIILRRDTASSLEPPDSRKTSTNWGKSSRGHRASSYEDSQQGEGLVGLGRLHPWRLSRTDWKESCTAWAGPTSQLALLWAGGRPRDLLKSRATHMVL